jgi:glycine cleavage system H protein
MSKTYYTDQHEWIKVEGDIATVGITHYAVEQLGDAVFVEMPEIGKTLAKGDQAMVVESVKAASEVYAPVGGEVAQVNASLAEEPARLNADPEGEAWLFKLKLSDAGELSSLMDAERYAEFVKGA